MATCPACDADDLEVDEFDVEEGDIVNCPECGASLVVNSLSPLEFETADDEDEDETTTRTRKKKTKKTATTKTTSTRTMKKTSGRTGRSSTSADDAFTPDARALDAERALRDLFSGFGSALVAFSGGVDSAYLAWIAHDVLGDRALAVTALSESYPAHHYDLALTLARQAGFPHEVVHTREMERPEYRANPVNRCYYCKDELYTVLGGLARARGLAVIVDGNNADDRGDYRPGRQAAREAGVRSPLDEVGLDKAAIRALAHRAGLPQWDEPASACLSSRVPYEQEVTPEKLRAIEQAETALRALGFRGCRVRHHDDVARLELQRADLARAVEPETRAGDRGGGQGRGLPFRRPRSRGISHRQPQRSHPAPGDRLTSVPQPDPAGAGRAGLFDSARRWTWLALALGLVALLLHVARRPRSSRRRRRHQLHARRARLRRRAGTSRIRRATRCSSPRRKSSPARRRRSAVSAGWCRRPGPRCRSRPRRSRCWR